MDVRIFVILIVCLEHVPVRGNNQVTDLKTKYGVTEEASDDELISKMFSIGGEHSQDEELTYYDDDMFDYESYEYKEHAEVLYVANVTDLDISNRFEFKADEQITDVNQTTKKDTSEGGPVPPHTKKVFGKIYAYIKTTVFSDLEDVPRAVITLNIDNETSSLFDNQHSQRFVPHGFNQTLYNSTIYQNVTVKANTGAGIILILFIFLAILVGFTKCKV